jgi:hypothetical protein
MRDWVCYRAAAAIRFAAWMRNAEMLVLLRGIEPLTY